MTRVTTLGELAGSIAHEVNQPLAAIVNNGDRAAEAVHIAANDLDHVFSAFFTTKPGGMGMGLSISRSMIESHGPALGHCNPTHGSTSHFGVPVEGFSGSSG